MCVCGRGGVTGERRGEGLITCMHYQHGIKLFSNPLIHGSRAKQTNPESVFVFVLISMISLQDLNFHDGKKISTQQLWDERKSLHLQLLVCVYVCACMFG